MHHEREEHADPWFAQTRLYRPDLVPPISLDDMGFGYGERERGPHYGKGPKGYKRSDERIREDVSDAIGQDGYVDASDVEVKVEAGIVTLTGTVDERPEKRHLERIAEQIYGVEEVRNEIRLKRGRA
jgi:osmotically-inducible protein OsmY